MIEKTVRLGSHYSVTVQAPTWRRFGLGRITLGRREAPRVKLFYIIVGKVMVTLEHRLRSFP